MTGLYDLILPLWHRECPTNMLTCLEYWVNLGQAQTTETTEEDNLTGRVAVAMKTIIGITRQVGSRVQASILSGLLFSRDLEVTSKASTGRILFHFRWPEGSDLEAGLFLTLYVFLQKNPKISIRAGKGFSEAKGSCTEYGIRQKMANFVNPIKCSHWPSICSSDSRRKTDNSSSSSRRDREKGGLSDSQRDR